MTNSECEDEGNLFYCLQDSFGLELAYPGTCGKVFNAYKSQSNNFLSDQYLYFVRTLINVLTKYKYWSERKYTRATEFAYSF